MQKVALRDHLGLYEDETAALCHWHLAEAHYLESWSDVRSDDGTVTIIQPLIAPLYGGKSAHEVMSALSSSGERSGYDLVRATWSRLAAPPGAASAGPVLAPAPAPPATRAAAPAAPPTVTPAGGAAAPAARAAAPTAAPGAANEAAAAFEREWRKWLHDGIVANTAFAPKSVALQANVASQVAPRNPAQALEVVFRGDPTVHDGRFANNAWLQETPKSLTKLTWDNAVLIASGTDDRLRPITD